jgi:hypothetical protein
MSLSDDKQVDLLITVALTRFSVEFENSHPELSNQAWQLAVDRAATHKLRAEEAVEQLDWDHSPEG